MRRAYNAWVAAVGDTTTTRSIYQALADLYREPSRRYHTFGHVLACLSLLRTFQEDTSQITVTEGRHLELAIWFHDAVYDARRKDNEEQSAELAAESCRRLGFAESTQSVVRRLIQATAHFGDATARAPVDEPLTDVIRDIDLAVLGTPPAQFAWYDWAVRQEYGHLTDLEFEDGRRRVCLFFLQRPRLYQTAWFSRRYDGAARGNLAARIRKQPLATR